MEFVIFFLGVWCGIGFTSVHTARRRDQVYHIDMNETLFQKSLSYGIFTIAGLITLILFLEGINR